MSTKIVLDKGNIREYYYKSYKEGFVDYFSYEYDEYDKVFLPLDHFIFKIESCTVEEFLQQMIDKYDYLPIDIAIKVKQNKMASGCSINIPISKEDLIKYAG